jgi:hypothetical protein
LAAAAGGRRRTGFTGFTELGEGKEGAPPARGGLLAGRRGRTGFTGFTGLGEERKDRIHRIDRIWRG